MKDQNSTGKLSIDIHLNMIEINQKIVDCPDIITRSIQKNGSLHAVFLYIEKQIELELANRDFIKPILDAGADEVDFEAIPDRLPVGSVHSSHKIGELLDDILNGEIIYLQNGFDCTLSSSFKRTEHRAITEPSVEKTVKGSHEGFIESLDVNVSILRRKIMNTELKFKQLKVGTTCKQSVVIAYINGIANPEMVNLVYDKISKINFDGLNGAGYIEQIITDHPSSIFPQIMATERPDKAMPALLEGRLVVLLDGTPVALILPVTFFSFFQAPDDYNQSWLIGSFLRLIRLLGMMIALFLPGIYIAILTFHYFMVPLSLLVPIAESRTRVPFPPVLEAMIMELIIEFLKESAVRLPTYVGTSIGIVGGLVLGQAAVEAGIVSNMMVIIVGVTAISSFLIPSVNMSYAIRITRFFIMVLSSIFGLLGVTVSMVLILAHLMTLESMGQPYFQPIVPIKWKGLKDAIARLPLAFQKSRPNDAKPIDPERGRRKDGNKA